MTIGFMDPVTLPAGAATAQGTVVPAGTKRKYTKMTAHNASGLTTVLRVYLVPIAGVAGGLTRYVDYNIGLAETYLCPEVIGAVLGAGGQIWVAGTGLSFSAVWNDTINS